jgi:hypothetical protein
MFLAANAYAVSAASYAFNEFACFLCMLIQGK